VNTRRLCLLIIWTLAALAMTDLPTGLAAGPDERRHDRHPEELRGYSESQERAMRLASPRLDDGSQDQPGWSALVGMGFRGTRSEAHRFDESLGFELGLGLPFAHGLDVVAGVGGLTQKGAGLRPEFLARAFLFSDLSGPYLGLGWSPGDLKNQDDQASGFATLGVFGGSGLYLEFDFRTSNQRPIATIVEFGIRFRWHQTLDEEPPAKGPLVDHRAPSSTKKGAFRLLHLPTDTQPRGGGITPMPVLRAAER
jgi:hypothetical protein